MMTVPLFGSKNLPVLLKGGLLLSISIVLFPILKLDHIPFFTEVIPFCLEVIGEIILGVAIGLSVRLLFAGIQLAGQLAGFQMGLAIVNVMDPQTSAQVPILAQFNNLIAMLVFLAINAHHFFLRAIVESFRIVPPFEFRFSYSLMEQLMMLGSNMFIIAVKIGAPIMATMLITSVALGLIARTVPQMHIFIVAMPLKILIGLLLLSLTVPYFSAFLREVFNGLGKDVILLLQAIKV
ncbi:MAG: flagellar biosynthetic protein FliR [Desulfobacteraceae bacterium]|nr:MAG: flagellar biosynthetic protein FliR [Desulfobacteraceae bacterium]